MSDPATWTGVAQRQDRMQYLLGELEKNIYGATQRGYPEADDDRLRKLYEARCDHFAAWIVELYEQGFINP